MGTEGVSGDVEHIAVGMRVTGFRVSLLGRLRKGFVSVEGDSGAGHQRPPVPFIIGHGMAVIPRNELELALVEVD